jgi:FlgD Ig-like domain
VPRLFSTALLFTLLGATATAFVVTEGLKLEPSPIAKVRVTKVFSPTCECPTDFAVIKFQLRKADRVTVSVVGKGRRLVRTLVGPSTRKKGLLLATWDGRDEDGAVVPDGVYRPLVHLRHRTILMPNRVHIDTTPPLLKLLVAGPHVLGPGKRFKVRYLLNERGRVYVFLNGRRVVTGRSTRPRWNVQWRAHGRPGKYRVTVAARDIAGNLSDASRAISVVIPLRVLTQSVRVAAGRRFGVRIESDGRAYHWALAKRRGFARSRRLVLRAPGKPGRYTLVIRQDKIPHRIAVTVSK